MRQFAPATTARNRRTLQGDRRTPSGRGFTPRRGRRRNGLHLAGAGFRSSHQSEPRPDLPLPPPTSLSPPLPPPQRPLLSVEDEGLDWWSRHIPTTPYCQRLEQFGLTCL